MVRLINEFKIIVNEGFFEDVIFFKFSDCCLIGWDMVIVLNFQSDDGNYRMEVFILIFVDVDEEFKIFYLRFNLGYLVVKRYNFFFFLNFK